MRIASEIRQKCRKTRRNCRKMRIPEEPSNAVKGEVRGSLCLVSALLLPAFGDPSRSGRSSGRKARNKSR